MSHGDSMRNERCGVHGGYTKGSTHAFHFLVVLPSWRRTAMSTYTISERRARARLELAARCGGAIKREDWRRRQTDRQIGSWIRREKAQGGGGGTEGWKGESRRQEECAAESEGRWERRGGGAIADFGGRSGAPCFPSVRSQFQSRVPSLLRKSANRGAGGIGEEKSGPIPKIAVNSEMSHLEIWARDRGPRSVRPRADRSRSRSRKPIYRRDRLSSRDITRARHVLRERN